MQTTLCKSMFRSTLEVHFNENTTPSEGFKCTLDSFTSTPLAYSFILVKSLKFPVDATTVANFGTRPANGELVTKFTDDAFAPKLMAARNPE